ncbi:TetR/AcrR family transcriptional regulator [Actinoplanes philippinensis]|uniref:TetR/AcrR family transcriptional regulator n=1 Tax=Actinoplanes philippinensis TaxID=35752 RepID=UPI0033F6D6EE
MVKPGRDPRAELVEAGARVLAEQGPDALSARSLARAAGTSTMAVYTHFGGMPAVVRAIIHEGFGRLAAELAGVPPTADPVADCAALALAYRRAAHRAPHLYRVMFGATGFELTDEDRGIGAYTLRVARDAVARCIEAGRFHPAEPWVLTRRSWCLAHGLVSLELAGFLGDPAAGDADFRDHLTSFAVGAGDDPARARASVAEAFTP